MRVPVRVTYLGPPAIGKLTPETGNGKFGGKEAGNQYHRRKSMSSNALAR